MIVFIGDVGIDRYYLTQGRVCEFWGGCALNAWLGAGAHAGNHRLLSIRARTTHLWPQVLANEAQYWPSSQAAPPVQEIELDASGERHFKHYEAGALSELTLTKDFKELIKNCELVALPLYAQTQALCLEVLQSIAKDQRKVALDLGVMNDIEDYSFLIPYLDRIYYVQTSGKAWPYQSRNLPIHSVITQGRDPVLYQFEFEQLTFTPASVASVVDSTGAGDFFFGRMLSQLLAGENVAQACHHAQLGAQAILGQLGPNLLK